MNSITERYPKGTRVRLINMNDPYGVPSGTEGTVISFGGETGDAFMNVLYVNWDNGSTLNIALDEDTFEVIK